MFDRRSSCYSTARQRTEAGDVPSDGAVLLVRHDLVVVADLGVHTFSPCWVPDDACERWMRANATRRGDGGAWLLPEPIAGFTVGRYPSGLVFAEGPALPDRLCPPAMLSRCYSQIKRAMRGQGVPVPDGRTRDRSPGFAGLRRFDIAVDLAPDYREEGDEFLSAAAALLRPRGRVERIDGPSGALSTITIRGANRRVLARIYDRSHTTSSPLRSRLRLEVQRRPHSNERPTSNAIRPAVAHAMLARTFAPVLSAPRIVVVGDLRAVLDHLDQLVNDNTIAADEHETLCGFVTNYTRGTFALSRATRYRRVKRLHQLGVALDDNSRPLICGLPPLGRMIADSPLWHSEST